jgi:hypothetical protein
MKKKLKGSSPRYIRGILTYCINGVLSGTVTPEQAHAVAKLASTMLKAFETIEMEDRLKELELKLGVSPKPKLIKSDITRMIKELEA